LEKHTDRQLLDFFHATEYLADVAHAAFPGKTDKPKRKAWLHERCKQLKHEVGAIDALITAMEKLAKRKKLTKSTQENLVAAQTYHGETVLNFLTSVSQYNRPRILCHS
jgi:hypothetical protein